MKTRLYLFCLLLLPFSFLLSPCWAQVPQGFNYQAIARDSYGLIITNQSIPVEITLQTSLSGGTIIYKELFSSIISDKFGMINLVVGTGTQTGGYAASFSAIDWSAQPLFLKTAVEYPGSTWTTMGTSQVWSVPYSMQAKNVGPLSSLGITGTTSDMEEALFEVKNRAGQTVFAIYNEGIRAYVGNGDSKGKKGGFAVGGYDATKGSTIYDLLTLNTDSARLYFDSKPTGKGKKGGFSVGGYDMTKGGILQKYLDITPATTKIVTTDTILGFAIGNASSGSAESYLKLTPRNYLIGHEAGKNLTTGFSNSFIGYKAGLSNTKGNYNVFIGERSGYNNIDGIGNTFIGDSAGCKNTTGKGNVYLGGWAGQETIDGSYNTFLGTNAGALSTSGNQNIYIGFNSGLNNTGGTRNTFIGCSAGQNNKIGSYNVSLGNFSGYLATEGDGNTYLGSYAGRNNLTGNWNICIGYAAGRDETGSQRLYVANSATATPLIFGELDNGRVVINGNSLSNISSNNFFVNGSAGGLVSWLNVSDRRLKHDIITIPDALQKVLQLRGVNFLWNNPVEGMEGLQMGFIGQESETVVPEVVSVNNDHYSMQYAPITALLVEAVKEQQKQIDSQKSEIDDLKAMVNSLISDKSSAK